MRPRSTVRTHLLTSDDGSMRGSLPSLSARLRDVRSSPVRDILELTQRDEVISFAACPHPSCFPPS